MNLDRIERNITLNDNGCWVWNKSVSSSGYGQFSENGKYWNAHVYAYACVNETPQKGSQVRHSCHNRKCCNPSHLSTGTAKDNYHDSKETHDRVAKNRRKQWIVDGVTYATCREAVEKTGISMNSIIKYTKECVFDRESYEKGKIKGFRRYKQ